MSVSGLYTNDTIKLQDIENQYSSDILKTLVKKCYTGDVFSEAEYWEQVGRTDAYRTFDFR